MVRIKMDRKLFLSGVILFVLSSSFFIVFVNAQVPWGEWIQSYGGTGNDRAYSVVVTSDGGYALGGYTNSSGAGQSDFWLIKTDASGNVEWNQTYGGASHDLAYSMVATSDGGFALAGSTRSFDVGIRDFWLVKTDSLGNVEWNQSYGGEHTEVAYSLVQTSDEGFALVGYRYYADAGYDFWIVKTDDHGNMEWNRTSSGIGYSSIAYSIIETSNLGLAIAGYTETYGDGIDYIRLIKTDSSGSIEWEFQSEGADGDRCKDVVETADEGFVLACKIGSTASEVHELGLIKIDSEGKQIWNQTYGEGYANSLIVTSDGGFALTGYTRLGYGNVDFLLVKTDNSGNEQWRRFYGTPEHERAHSIVETSDGFALAGYREIWGPDDDYDSWLVRTNIQGIPEFPSWIILPIFLTATLVTAFFRKSLKKSGNYI